MPGGLKPLVMFTGGTGGLVHQWTKLIAEGDAEILMM